MKFSPVMLAMSIVMSIYLTAYIGFCIPVYIVLFILWIIYSSINRHIDIAMLLCVIAAIAGGALYTVSSSSLVHKTINYIGHDVSLTGVVSSAAQESYDNYRYTFYVKTLTENNITTDIGDTVMLTSPNKFSCGESITVKGTLKDFDGQMNEGGFDIANHYKSQGIFARIYSEDITECDPIFMITPSILCGKFRQWVDSFIYKYYYGDGAAVLSAVLTGNTHHFSDEFNTVLNRTAFRHLYHPAFLHMLIISLFIGLFTGFVPKKIRNVGLIVILLIYATLNCAHIGFARCLIVAALTVFLKMKNGSSHYPDTVALLLTVVAVFMPMMLLNTGFILSVAAGIFMWAFMPYFIDKFKRLPRILRRTTAAVTVILFIYSPVALLFYSGICIYTILMPFITMPLVTVVLITSPIVFTMLSLFGFAMPIKPYLDGAVLALLKLPELIYKLPFSRITIPTPSPVGTLFIISMLFLFYSYINRKKLHQLVGAILSGNLALLLIISAILRIGTTEFMFVNVGQGDGAVIHTAYGPTVLIDGGGGLNYSEYNPGESVYLPYLESKGLSDIDAAFISHLHRDHAQGIIAAIENLRVKNVFLPAPEQDWDEEMLSLLKETEAAAAKSGTNVHYITDNIRLSFKGGLTVSVYAPNEAVLISKNENDSSLLIKAKYKNTDVLYTGDMTAYAEREYIRRGIDLSADILKVAHHGSAESTNPDWVSAVNPDYAVISCGKDNSYGHPKPETLNNLRGIRLFRTDLNGDIKITVRKNGSQKITTLR